MSDHIKQQVKMTVVVEIDGIQKFWEVRVVSREMLDQCQSRGAVLRDILRRISDLLVTKTVEYDNRGDVEFLDIRRNEPKEQ